ncbi:RICIN domain-containing protein [Streptomyces formicae]|uniref:RICIN domain-containing protein n=1 Tax=Streptomyces formicae TaxID=1616117 RepID=A0ABY3WSK3_9ACTN|nr:RICIN domain-containing protein [Streptomyces formicae]UNM14546.1 RICIN domain-containing protein [Streptomyces formicae]
MAGLVVAGPLLGQVPAFAADAPEDPAVSAALKGVKLPSQASMIGREYRISLGNTNLSLEDTPNGRVSAEATDGSYIGQEWKIVAGEHGAADAVQLRSVKNPGTCLSHEGLDGLSTNPGNCASPAMSHWKIVDNGDGLTYRIEATSTSVTNKVLTLNSEGSARWETWNDSDAQKIVLDSTDFQKILDNPVTIGGNASGKVLDRHNVNSVGGWDAHVGAHQQWRIERSGDRYQIKVPGTSNCLVWKWGSSHPQHLSCDETKWEITRNADGSFGLAGVVPEPTQPGRELVRHLGMTANGDIGNIGNAEEKKFRINPVSQDVAKASPGLLFGWSTLNQGMEVHFKNNTGKFLKRQLVGVTHGNFALNEAPEILQPGQTATVVVHGSAKGAMGNISYSEWNTNGNRVATYAISYDNPAVGKNDYILTSDRAPMYFASTKGAGMNIERTQKAPSPANPNGYYRFNSDVAGGGDTPVIFVSAGAPDKVEKAPLRADDSKCTAYAQAIRTDFDWLDHWGANLPYHYKKFIQALLKSSTKLSWSPFNDGSTGARLGGFIGGAIAGCDPWKAKGAGALIAGVFGDFGNSKPWEAAPYQPKPKPPHEIHPFSVTSDGPVTVNGFGNDYTAKPGEILGKDGKEGLKTKILREGEPAKGVGVEFSVPADSGLHFKDADGKHVTSVKATTDAKGEAVAPVLYAGEKEGDFKVTVTADAPGATKGEKPTAVYSVHVKN